MGTEHMSKSKRGLWIAGGVAAAVAAVFVGGLVDMPTTGDNVTGQTVSGNPDGHHSCCNRQFFKYRHPMAESGQPVCHGHSGRTGPHDSHLFGIRSAVNFQFRRVTAGRFHPIGNESF